MNPRPINGSKMVMKKAITICSSGSFYKEVLEVQKELKKLGFAVKIPKTANIMKRTGDYNIDNYKTWYKDRKHYKKKTQLMLGHFKKVTDADAILVINGKKKGIDGYVGGNTLMEMTVAYLNKKPIFLWKDVNSKLFTEEEVRGLNPIIINEDIDKIAKYYKKHHG